MDELSRRAAAMEAARSMDALGINHGTSGNAGARFADRTPIALSATPCGARAA